MALSLQLGFPDVPKSTTNPNVNSKDALDNGSPMPFLTFIKIINVSFEPDSLQNYYNYYLKTWNNKTKGKVDDGSALIVEKYKEFLRDISLDYTTVEEKKFLSKINFNDPLDLDIAIGFYSRKLKEISVEYNDKRNDIKYNLVRNKIKGTNFGTERSIFEITLSYLKNLDDGKILYNFDLIKSKIEIEIEELYDTYPTYFNKSPDPLSYDAKDLDYGYDIFLKSNSDLISTIFKGVSSDIIALKEADQLFDNRRVLTEKYISTDFYYLSTGNTVTDFLSGKLFTADKPSSNFLNRDYPTTASTEETGYLQSPREKGFFKPSNTSIILVDGKHTSYSFNFENLTPNSLYYFADPSIIGNNGEVLSFIVDDNFLKRNFSSGNASNQPYSSPNDTGYSGYISKTEPSRNKYLDSIFDAGFVKDAKKDVYNNLYGLFNDDFRFKKTVKGIDQTTQLNLLIDGYKFYDELYEEGLAFDYTQEDDTTYTETIRTGLSFNARGFVGNPPDITLFFGFFTPHIDLIEPTESVKTFEILEGGFFSNQDGSPYPTDYYTDLIDGGNFTSNPRVLGIPSTDCGEFYEPFPSDLDFLTLDYSFDNSTFNPTSYVINTPTPDDYPNWETEGVVYIRNSNTRQVLPLINTLSYLPSKYPTDVISEISNNVQRFEVTNDIIFTETPSYLVINKISFTNGVFADPKTVPYYITHDTNTFDKLSNRFKIGSDVYYYRLNRGTDSDLSNDFIVYPEIYKFDLVNFTNELLFPRSPSDITTFFSLSGGDVRYTSTDSPKLTYNSRNNSFAMSFIVKDQNNMFALQEFDFTLTPDINFTNHRKLNPTPNIVSNTFNGGYTSNLNVFLSAGPSSTVLEELIW